MMRWNLPKEYKRGDKRIIDKWALPFPEIVGNKKIWAERYWSEQVYAGYDGRTDVYWKETNKYLWENKPKAETKKKNNKHWMD